MKCPKEVENNNMIVSQGQNSLEDVEEEESDNEEGESDFFPFPKKLVRSLWKCKMCIRPISTKGSASAKKKSRELTNLLRSLEKEVEKEEAELETGHLTSQLRSSLAM